MTEKILVKVLRVAVSDESNRIRLALVKFFDSRFDLYLCRAHHIEVRKVVSKTQTPLRRVLGTPPPPPRRCVL